MSASSPKSPRRRRLPASYYNATTLIGALVAALALGLIAFMIILEATASDHNPYVGIVAFVILPAFLVLGLAIAIFGIVRQQRRRRLGLPSTEKLPTIDFNNPTHMRATLVLGIGGVLFAAMSGFGTYKAYEYTESDEFCGTMCHEVMEPEYTAYSVSPHAHVGCVKCHIGPGAEWFVKAKISGLYQVYAVLFDKVPRPIETPIANLRPSRDTCEQCHWPAHFSNDKLVIHDYYGYEEENTHWKLHLLMKIGGGTEIGPTHGIHYEHIYDAETIEYVATDEKRTEIPWVRATDRDGNVRIFRDNEADFDDAQVADHEIRTMDCIDCHNRPTHHYNPPARLVNEAMALGHIDPALPGIKTVAVDLLSEEYESTPEAFAAIETGIREHYAEADAELAAARAAEIEQTIETTKRLFDTNIFPEMKVNWRDFPDHIGHLNTPGCFRCHDGNHETEDGQVISRDCNICHTIMAQERKDGAKYVSLESVEYVHPEDIDGEWKVTDCSECHGG
ncbi:NapC/NirT family cytochrome c [bacterium]|nr:NapC/NirT family cytochrome c [bacterium]